MRATWPRAAPRRPTRSAAGRSPDGPGAAGGAAPAARARATESSRRGGLAPHPGRRRQRLVLVVRRASPHRTRLRRGTCEFRQHLQEVYRRLGEPDPHPTLPARAAQRRRSARPAAAAGTIEPTIDGRLTDEDGWDTAGLLLPDHPSTMQRAEGTRIVEARFGWGADASVSAADPSGRGRPGGAGAGPDGRAGRRRG